MRSHLTRHVFRRLIQNGPYLSARCACVSGPTGRLRREAPSSTPASRRTIFGLSRKPRELRDADLDPGLGKMLELNLLSKANARPPPTADLVKAFNAFFRARQKSKEPLQEIQAKHALRTFEHLQPTPLSAREVGLSVEDLQLARDSLVYMPKDNVETHNKLARALFTEIKRRKEADASVSLPMPPKDILPYVMVLAQTGDSAEARELVYVNWQTNPGASGQRLWLEVLKGFAAEKNEVELLRTMSIMEKYGVPFGAKQHQTMTIYYALKNDVAATKKWYGHPIAEGGVPTYHTNAQILKFCIRNDELDWGQGVFRSILESNPNKKTWDLIFQWAAANGKGVDEIDRMMDVMVRRNAADESIRPDIETINDLVEAANVRSDSYTAERYVALGQKRAMVPNARTYVLQLDYRVHVGDLDGAKVTYNALQGQESVGGEDVPAINRFVQALCAARQPPYDEITTIVADLAERKARLEPATVSALCMMHLRREELYDVHDLLQAHTFHYSGAQREVVMSTFVDFCLDRKNSTALAWDAYSILKQVFAETPVATRTRLMNDFFQRGRSDMGCHVFGHMRQHFRPEWRPNAETYIECLTGIARLADAEGLAMVHNQLKLDSSIEPCTRLYNALMLAYTAAEMPLRSLDYWQDIIQSQEGPTYSSVVIALQACEVVADGDARAREIWQRLKGMDVEVTEPVAAAFVGALAGQDLLAEAVAAVEGLAKEVGVHPGVLAIGTLYNAIPNQPRKDEVQKWAAARYPAVWKQLVDRVGQRTTEDGETKTFNINRDATP